MIRDATAPFKAEGQAVSEGSSKWHRERFDNWILQWSYATERPSPGNRLEALRGDRVGQHSICINDQWRIYFVWGAGDAYDVEVVDYH